MSVARVVPAHAGAVASRVAALDRPVLHQSLHGRGFAITAALLSPTEAAELAGLHDGPARFRSRVVMW